MMVYKAVVLGSAEGRGGVFLEGCARALLRFGVDAVHETEERGVEGRGRGRGRKRRVWKRESERLSKAKLSFPFPPFTFPRALPRALPLSVRIALFVVVVVVVVIIVIVIVIFIISLSLIFIFILVFVLIGRALNIPRHMHPIIRIRNRVPNDDGRILVQAFDHPLRDRAPAELDPV
jgi:hypothetical protein